VAVKYDLGFGGEVRGKEVGRWKETVWLVVAQAMGNVLGVCM
jgi:hypothetical protein